MQQYTPCVARHHNQLLRRLAGVNIGSITIPLELNAYCCCLSYTHHTQPESNYNRRRERVSACIFGRAKSRRYYCWKSPLTSIVLRINHEPRPAAIYGPFQVCDTWPSFQAGAFLSASSQRPGGVLNELENRKFTYLLSYTRVSST